jgi:hypothetical protein
MLDLLLLLLSLSYKDESEAKKQTSLILKIKRSFVKGFCFRRRLLATVDSDSSPLGSKIGFQGFHPQVLASDSPFSSGRLGVDFFVTSKLRGTSNNTLAMHQSQLSS